MTRPVLLTFVAYYLPGYCSGGPMRSIANMVERFGEELDFRIVTSDRDATDTSPYPDIEVDAWNRVGKAEVFYASPNRQGVLSFAQLLRRTPHEVLYLNSFFHPVFTLRPLLSRRLGLAPKQPCVIAPRGELSAGALGLKPWKKEVYMFLSRLLRLYKRVIWQASNEYEAADIARVLGGDVGPIRVAPNLPAPEVAVGSRRVESRRDRGSPLRVLFLSRITPMKNLDFALRVLRQVSMPVEFNLYGPLRDKSYWDRCRGLIQDMPRHVTVVYHGSVPPSDVPEVMAAHDLFFLPTLGENYGHVVPEALSCGTPVLIADTTPWRNLEPSGVGWDLPLDSVQPFARCIERCAHMSGDEYARWRAVVRSYAARRLNDPATVEANRALFVDAAMRNGKATVA